MWVVVREGQPYVVGRVDLRGGGGLPETEVRDALQIVPGMRFQSAALADAVDRVEHRFRQAGFLEARAAVEATVAVKEPRVDIDLLVEAGPRSILRDVLVDGADPHKPLVARAITLTPGAPVDARALGETRQRLYDTGLYRSVEIDLQPSNPAAAASESEPHVPVEGDRPVAARIQLEERPEYSLRYGLAFNNEVVGTDMREQRIGFATDLAKRNLFSPGTTAGFSARLRRDFQVGRFYLGSERFFTLPLRSNVFVSRSREQPDSEDALAFVTDVTEIFGEQSYRLRRLVELRYGYGFGQNRTTIESEDIEVKFKVARLTSSALDRPAAESIRSSRRLVLGREHGAVEARARIRHQFPQRIPAVLPVRPHWAARDRCLGRAGGPCANVRGPAARAERALFCRRRDDGAWLSRGRSGSPEPHR